MFCFVFVNHDVRMKNLNQNRIILFECSLFFYKCADRSSHNLNQCLRVCTFSTVKNVHHFPEPVHSQLVLIGVLCENALLWQALVLCLELLGGSCRVYSSSLLRCFSGASHPVLDIRFLPFLYLYLFLFPISFINWAWER